ncbi:Homoserine O-acetyltransferase [Rubripirellula lacrimiformis]|uniref:Homoserine O-acetyltransferase n=1 Tax=Rubripirellula lacrimiformis TaxID=1930273 RepID=A0A517NB80_9BACT|nr:homoserine O-acetyltransferase [Rubripirellula lacrimiformis]QDT04380.1 Homoserine O-acetyltransferase [Rubripirellula lacrimiformis]
MTESTRSADTTSTDDIRSASPLRHVQSVDFEGPISLSLGGELSRVSCAFETWGRLNQDASNAVLVCHAISGDSHAARHDESDDPGWWEKLIGPGKAIDTDRLFVVCPNVLGGCRGTTGPSDIDPASDPPRPYGADFPRITIADMVDVQHMLAGHLGIKRWHAVVGGSLGGHQAMTWVTRYPKSAQTCVIIASSPRLTSQALGFDVIARNAIQTDPYFAGGQYYDQNHRPDTGLAIARMLGHITYLSSEAMEDKFDPDRHDPRQIASSFEQRFSVGSYLAHQGEKFTTRFDANSYVTLSMAMDLFDLGATRLQLMETFNDSDCDFLLVSFSSDWLFTPRQSRDIVAALTALNKRVTYAEITSTAGHDSFLVDRDIEQYAGIVEARLGKIETRQSDLSPVEELILSLIPSGASVLDLGCGDGNLLAALRGRGHDDLVGVEVAQANILKAAGRGLNVIDYDLNTGLPAFIDAQFDFVVLSATLQAVSNVAELFDEMLRVGKRVIVSFPNFAYRKLREDYVVRGRSPRAPGEFNYRWYDTPNRRFPSIADVLDLCREKQIEVQQEVYFDSETSAEISPEDDPNLNADTAILVISQPGSPTNP